MKQYYKRKVRQYIIDRDYLPQTTTRPVTGVTQVIAKGSPSWETNTARPTPVGHILGVGVQPVQTPVNSRPIITSDGNGNFNPPATFGQGSCSTHLVNFGDGH